MGRDGGVVTVAFRLSKAGVKKLDAICRSLGGVSKSEALRHVVDEAHRRMKEARRER